MTREDMLTTADAAWIKYSQPVNLPAGADSTISPCRLMAQIGFKLALIDAVNALCEQHAAAHTPAEFAALQAENQQYLTEIINWKQESHLLREQLEARAA